MVILWRDLVYAYYSVLYLFPWGWQFPSMNFHGLVYMLLVGAPHYMIPPFSMFHYRRDLEYFPRGWNNYNDMDNIMKLVKRLDKRGGRWEI